MTAIESALFCERLRRAGWTPEKIEQAVSVYSQWSGDMFSEHGASFQGAYFANPDGVVFRNVSLKTCRFANSNACRAQFQNVQWDRQATFLWAGARRAVSDERAAISIEALRAVGKLYYELRLNCEEKGLFEEASDFHYGEVEVQRCSQPFPSIYLLGGLLPVPKRIRGAARLGFVLAGCRDFPVLPAALSARGI